MPEKYRKIHVVGERGIGVSALARVLGAHGAIISGSDIETGGHRAENVPPDADLLIYSNAIPDTNPERMRAAELKIPELSYPEALGWLARGKRVIAVAGTNGKTTTTAMIGWIMEQAGLDPTVVVGSKVLAWNSNARVGRSDWLVLEADEYRRAFLNYEPDIAVITNISADHLDYYKDFEDIKTAFFQFTQKLRPSGTLVYNVDDENAVWIAEKFQGQAIGFASKSSRFDLKIPGAFNKANAAAAAAVCQILGVPQREISKALESFSGTWRRFERVGNTGSAEIISDYAHHPDGVRVTLIAAAEAHDPKKILAVFQPHQRNRTKKLFTEFVEAFCASQVEDSIISEIFDVAGREQAQDQDISSRDLVRELRKCGKNAAYAADLRDCEKMIREIAQNYEVIIIMGAGDIYKVADALASAIPDSIRDPALGKVEI